MSFRTNLLPTTFLMVMRFVSSVSYGCAESSPTPGLVEARPTSGQFVQIEHGYMVPYVELIPGTNITFEMTPIPEGEFLFGSPDNEASRKADEGPQLRVVMSPFWMGKCEVSWGEYRAYMAMYDVFKKLQRLAVMPVSSAERKAAGDTWTLIEKHGWNGNPEEDWGVDAVTSATPLYEPSFNYSAGDKPELPAVTMTQFAARQYTKWLSGIIGRDFRLPTEVEWEYAARAGSTGAYCFGHDRSVLRQYAWYEANSGDRTHPVGKKKTNAWGLHDMHGNVAEWVLDEYQANTYVEFGSGPMSSERAIRWPTKLYPRVIRGGSWLSSADECRSASRMGSEEDEWKLSDPNLPLSPWWFTEEPATGIGMRIIRPLTPLTAEAKKRVWEADVDAIRQDVIDRLDEGRAAMGVADPSLPDAIDTAKKIDSGK